MKQLSLWAALGIWATLCVCGTLYASWQGYGGRALAATLATMAFLLLLALGFAARGLTDGILSQFGRGTGMVLGASVLAIYLIYLSGTGTFDPAKVLAMTGLIVVPLGLASWAGTDREGAWQDFVVILGIWVVVKFGPTRWLWPYPGGHLAYVMTVLAAVNVALAAFVLLRRVKGVGYSIGWGNRWGPYVGGSFLAFACIAIPLGIAMRFIAFAPQWHRWTTYADLSVAILLFTAWPEELLFRGLLQNFLARASKSELAGWWTASVLFGFSHMTNLGFPNWRYVFLATIAGLFYGWTWRKTGSIFASALVHAAVDATWHFLFKTV